MSEVLFVVESGVALPPRTIPNAGPRDSKYPVDQLQEGQSFAIPLGNYNEDGSFTAFAGGSEEAEKQARQKQSQMSGLAKNRGIKLTTRYFSGADADNASPFASVKAPCLGVWHAGKATKKEKKADAPAAPAAPAAPQAPAAPVQADDETVVL